MVTMTRTEANLIYALGWLVEQIEEDVPREQMSKHLITALQDARDVLEDAHRDEEKNHV